MVLSGDGWTKGSVFKCGRCHQGVQQSGGSCVLILVSFRLDIAHREDAARVVFLFVFRKLGMYTIKLVSLGIET